MFPKRYLPFLMVAGLAACSSSGELTVAKPKSEAVRPSSTVALDVDSTEDSGTPEHVANGVNDVRQELFSGLQSSGVFSRVVQPTETADYTMQVDLTNVRFVSGSARFWGGALAGANVVTGNVNVVDNSNGIELTSFSAEGKSASHPISSETGFDDAVRQFGDKVVEGLQ